MKAILVIDIPNWNGCRNCQFNIGGDLCTARDYEDGEDGCPLKPLPEKKVVTVKRIEDIQSYSITEVADMISAKIILKTDEVFALGWNACIDSIIGENDCIDEITGETE